MVALLCAAVNAVTLKQPGWLYPVLDSLDPGSIRSTNSQILSLGSLSLQNSRTAVGRL